MNFEIAQQIGASSFLIFHVIKIKPNSTVRDITVETGLNETTVRNAVKKLEEAGIVRHELYKMPAYPLSMMRKYITNSEDKWLLN